MANRILTWLEFKTQLKEEINQQTSVTSVDDLLLALANEALTLLAQSGKNLREFRIDEIRDVTTISSCTISDIAIADIDQVYYHRYVGDVFSIRWDLIEQSGVPQPPPLVGFPNMYTWKQTTNNASTNLQSITFYPQGSAQIGDKIQIVGSGFQLIADDTTLMYYFPMYAWLKACILERYAASRNWSADRIKVYTGLIDRVGGAAVSGTADKGNSQATKQT